MSKIIGIDLGTTNSVVAVMDGGKATIITNPEGARTTPSVVAISEKDERLVGQVAKRQAITNPENTIYSTKRFIGRKYTEIQGELSRIPYKVEAAENGDVRIAIQGKMFSPQEISAMILRKVKEAAEAHLSEPVTAAVITVPAYFNDAQRQATKDAGKIAGLEVKRIINEPTAAALAYGLESKNDETIAVFDFGGGTFDISILEVSEGVVEVKATNGDTQLGGDDIDLRVIDWIVDEFKKDQGIDLSSDKMALQRLKEAAEKAKCELSTVSETEVNLPFITADASGPKHLQLKLNRAKFEQLVADLLNRTLEPCRKALADSGHETGGIDQVVLVGGSTRIPKVQEMVTEFFGKEPHKGVNPDEVVALGAAIQGGVLAGDVKDILLLDVTPLSLGIETQGGVFHKLIERNTTIPTEKSDVFSTAADNQTSVEVHVQQGEREMSRDNKTLGKFHLDGIPQAHRGIPQIEVSFSIDANGIVHVAAKDLGTGKEQKITITSSSGLDDNEVTRMIREAEEHAEEDSTLRAEVDTRNKADQMVYQTEKMLSESGDKLSDDDKKPVEEAISALKEAIEKNEISAIEGAIENLEKASQEMATKLYQAAGQPETGDAPGPEATPPSDDDEEVIEAEVVETGETKNS